MLDYSAVVTRVATATSWLTTVGWIWEIHGRKSEKYVLQNERNAVYKIWEMWFKKSEKYGCPPWVARPGWTLPPLRHLGCFLLQAPQLHPGGNPLKLESGKMEPAAAAVMFSSLRIRLVLLVVSFHRTTYLPRIIINSKLSSIKETCMILEDRFWIYLPIL